MSASASKVRLRYTQLVGSSRLIAAIVAAVVVLMPSMRAGLDTKHLLQPSASAAESPPSFAAPDASALGSTFRTSLPRVGDATTPGDPAAATGPQAMPAFGFGALTGFYPSDAPRELVLSFDDGPDLKFTPLVLDELERRGLKAVFFITGHRVIGDRPEDLARRELLHKIASRGHLVANHTLSHRNLCKVPEETATEIDGNAEVIAAATGVRPLLFRAPYGARCHSLESALAARELVSVGWNLDPQDWRNPTSEEILAYLEARLTKLEGRGILLLHDTHPASVFALGPLLDWIARENRRAVAEHRPPIVLRDYSAFLPSRPIPSTGLEAVVASVVRGLRRPAPLAAR
jgi:peptidoglycan/xylan/chitin deacetylase (PgdA/CDA1 family)